MRRTQVDTPSGSPISALVWGDEPAELVLIHGGAQNAHTWDTVALALGRPLVAVDLPGHGHSAWRPDRDYRPQAMADDVAAAIDALAPDAATLVGMSLGGLTAIATLATHPSVADRLALVDVTPGVNQEKAAAVVAFVDGPPELRQLRRPARAHHRLQPHPLGVVAAPRRAAQRQGAARRHLGVALRPTWASASRTWRPASATCGRPRRR